MEEKLIKTDDDSYYLYVGDKIYASSVVVDGKQKLSVKNCQAIEGGYDLYKIINDHPLPVSNASHGFGIKDGIEYGFLTAIELMGDRKFTEEEVILIAEYVRVASQSTPNIRTKDLFDECQSHKKKEWKVKIVRKNSRTGKIVKSDSDLEWDEDGLFDTAVPKLDSDGCLILESK